MRLRTAHLLVLALCAAMAASARAGTYLLWEEFDATDGGFGVVDGGPVDGPWVWDSVAGTWRTDGTENQGTPTFSELNSPVVTVAADGPLLLEFDHRYSFETGWDGGQMRVSLNGGGYQTVPGASFLANGYVGVITGNNILNGQEAFNGDSAGYGTGAFLTSVVDLGIFQAGDQVSVQFVGAWDQIGKGSPPNWEINSAAVWYSLMVRWTGAVSNDWYDAGNWDPAGTPADEAVRIVESGHPTASALVRADGAGAITITSEASVTFQAGLHVAGTTVGALTIAAGGRLEVGQTLKLWPGGTVQIDGGQVTCGSFDNSAGGTLDFSGGTLTVDGGSFVPPAGSFTLDGPGDPNLTLAGGSQASISGTLIAGGAARGTLNVAGGAHVTSTWAHIGSLANSTGAVTVAGDGSTWTNGQGLDVGWQGNGTLMIADGGHVTNGYVNIANMANSTGAVTVEGDGSTWTCSSGLQVGLSGRGTLTISDGGSVSNPSAFIGRYAGGRGTVRVEGEGSTWTSTSLYVGGSNTAGGGVGTVTVSDGGLLEVGGALKLWPGGTLGLAGGSLTAARLDISEGGTFSFTGGELHVGTFVGDLVNDGGAICPGGSIGLTAVDGRLVMNAGSIEIELGGTTPGFGNDNHDQINDSGTVLLAGSPTLAILPWNGFVPEVGDEFVILTWQVGLDGQFGAVEADPWFTDRGITFDLHYGNVDGPGNLTIAAVPEPATLALLALGGLAVVGRRRGR